MKTLYLVRHGTVLNPHNVVYRRLPGFLLSEQGHTEAGETRDYLQRAPIEVIWHSPLERAVQTATIVNERHQAPMAKDERIHEWAEAETPDDVIARMGSFLEHWRSAPYTVSVAVSHRDPIRRLLFAIRDPEAPVLMDDLLEFPLPQGGVYRVIEDGAELRAQLAFVPSAHAERLPVRIPLDEKVTG